MLPVVPPLPVTLTAPPEEVISDPLFSTNTPWLLPVAGLEPPVPVTLTVPLPPLICPPSVR